MHYYDCGQLLIVTTSTNCQKATFYFICKQQHWIRSTSCNPKAEGTFFSIADSTIKNDQINPKFWMLPCWQDLWFLKYAELFFHLGYATKSICRKIWSIILTFNFHFLLLNRSWNYVSEVIFLFCENSQKFIWEMKVRTLKKYTLCNILKFVFQENFRKLNSWFQ